MFFPHSRRPIIPRALSLTLAYPTVLTIVHFDGTSILSLDNIHIYGWRPGQVEGLQYVQAAQDCGRLRSPSSFPPAWQGSRRINSLTILDFQCGQQKPQCAQCIKSDRVCTGYQRERIFILNHAAGQEGPKIYTRLAPSKIHTSRPTGLEKGRVNLSSRKKELANARSTDSRTSQAVIIQTLPPHLVYRQQLLSGFLICNRLIADSTMRPYDSKEDRSATWLRHLPELATRSEALELSILAVCTANLGRLNNDPMLVDNSLRFYVQGLSELQKALWDSTQMHKDETLAVCMVLSLYEGIECPAKTRFGWMSHVKGCAKLIRLRGPEAHASNLGHELFLAFRFREVRLTSLGLLG